ncbi:hypothetical protein RINTHH_14790 [Richelia intracellularis HH01]|uniref:Uncharacterized protein n=1 Tax=Richelia intracellularis HH01 TaxID=1165094 RepID=M1WST4_9NOST|nr:hypothetical protein RINTHH_14790 [Richelia intracellularis HH01]
MGAYGLLHRLVFVIFTSKKATIGLSLPLTKIFASKVKTHGGGCGL